MKVYMAAIRDAQLTMGYQWNLRGNERLRRCIRWIKRKFPCAPHAMKFSITTSILRVILPLLRGWPVLSTMSHNDRLFAVASVLGTSAFLRGGEFLVYPKSVRPVLMSPAINVKIIAGSGRLSTPA